MVTINPATMLHVADRIGSIKVGKDADIVVWSDNPLSIYAKPEETIVDGTVYFDMQHDLQLRKQISAERNRLVQKMIAEGKTEGGAGAPRGRATPSFQYILSCGDHDHHDGLITVDISSDDEANSNK
jgi:hypothetical protein